MQSDISCRLKSDYFKEVRISNQMHSASDEQILCLKFERLFLKSEIPELWIRDCNKDSFNFIGKLDSKSIEALGEWLKGNNYAVAGFTDVRTMHVNVFLICHFSMKILNQFRYRNKLGLFVYEIGKLIVNPVEIEESPIEYLNREFESVSRELKEVKSELFMLKRCEDERKTKKKLKKMCTSCKLKKKSAALDPCGHMFCERCAYEIKDQLIFCSLCGQRIFKILQVNL